MQGCRGQVRQSALAIEVVRKGLDNMQGRSHDGGTTVMREPRGTTTSSYPHSVRASTRVSVAVGSPRSIREMVGREDRMAAASSLCVLPLAVRADWTAVASASTLRAR